MMREQFITKRLGDAKLALIQAVNDVIAEFQAQGYNLTLRQVYYQLVAKDLIPNNQKSYKRLGGAVSDGRLCGLISWSAIEDRGRNLHQLDNWGDPADIVRDAGGWYQEDLWWTQPVRFEVWCEKDALSGVFRRVCDEHRIPFLATKGYCSQSEVWQTSQRIERQRVPTVLLHFADHDPSGIDMTRDLVHHMLMLEVATYWDEFDEHDQQHLTDNQWTYAVSDPADAWLVVKRIALTMDHVQEFDPPPNPAKVTDSRATGYISRFGHESWELDALRPQVLSSLVSDIVEERLDRDAWEEALARERRRADWLREHARQMEGWPE